MRSKLSDESFTLVPIIFQPDIETRRVRIRLDAIFPIPKSLQKFILVSSPNSFVLRRRKIYEMETRMLRKSEIWLKSWVSFTITLLYIPEERKNVKKKNDLPLLPQRQNGLFQIVLCLLSHFHKGFLYQIEPGIIIEPGLPVGPRNNGPVFINRLSDSPKCSSAYLTAFFKFLQVFIFLDIRF